MNVELHPFAAEELQEAAEWYERRTRGVGDRFYTAVSQAANQIGRRPLAWASWPGLEDPPAVRRYVMKPFPYTLPYVILEDPVLIIAVSHTSREPAY